MARLKKYVNAYNITADGVLEKDDLIEKILAARVSVLLYVTHTPYNHSRDRARTVASHTQMRYGVRAS